MRFSIGAGCPLPLLLRLAPERGEHGQRRSQVGQHGVRVAVHRQRDCRMPGELLGNLRMHTPSGKGRNERVPQSVKVCHAAGAVADRQTIIVPPLSPLRPVPRLSNPPRLRGPQVRPNHVRRVAGQIREHRAG
ncbi:MAG: hypothetical protein J5J06_06410 [Phycisphaerae bacterium]|nr:hypothetical protein [Phycisphaerae bacterium]